MDEQHSHPTADTGPIPVVVGSAYAVPSPAVAATKSRAGSVGRNGVAAGVLAVGLMLVLAAAAFAALRSSDSATPVASSSQGSAAGPDAEAAAGPQPTSGAGTAQLPPSQPTLVLGDSLGLTVYPWLADLLPDRYVSYEAEVGRSTAATAAALEQMSKIPKLVLVSSGTNDANASDVEAGATRILDRLGSTRCVVWVDVVRPDRVGDPQAEINAALDRAVAGRANVRVLRWSELVAANPSWLSSDGIHPGQDGAEARAKAFADAATACSPLDPAAPKADQQFLPSSVFFGPLQGQGSAGSGGSGSSGSGSSGSGSGGSGSGGSGSSGSSRTPSASATRSSTPTPSTSRTPTSTPTSPSPKPTTVEPPPSPTVVTPPADPPPAGPTPA